MNHQAVLHEAALALAPELCETLAALVRIPSLVGHEQAGQAFMERLYRSCDLAVETIAPDEAQIRAHEAYVETGFPYDETRENVIATLEGDEAQPATVLNGHIDVVSAEPTASWQHDPFGAEIVGDRLYGRGAYDMKAGLIANLFAIKALQRSNIKPKGTVVLQSVIEEEAGGSGGSLALMTAGKTPGALIITEPQPKITVAMAGIAYFRVRVLGRTAHAGQAHLGENAITKMMPIIAELLKLDAERASRNRYRLFEEGSGRSCHLVPGMLRAGDWPSSVAGWAELSCRMSFIPGETLMGVRAEVQARIAAACEHDPWLREHPPAITWFGWQTNPWEQDPEHPFVRSFQEAVFSVTQRPVDIVGKAAGLDTRFAQYFGLPALTYGPDGAGAHSPNEWVDLPSVTHLVEILALFLAGR